MVESFTIGQLVTWVLDVLGFNLVDTSAATMDLLYLFLALVLGVLVYKVFFK